jgi:predicted nucleotidyltransferase
MKHKLTYAEKKLHSIDTYETIKQQAEELIASLQKKLLKIKEINAIILFGSFARGDYSVRHSDIDLMIFLDTKDKKQEEKIKKKIIALTLGKAMHIHALFQYAKIEDEDRSLMLTIAREGKVLFARKSIVISQNILGLKPFILLRFDTTGLAPVIKNKLQRFLYGYTIKGKKYQGIVNGENVLSAGQGAIIIPQDMQNKIMLFVEKIGVKAVQKGKFYK